MHVKHYVWHKQTQWKKSNPFIKLFGLKPLAPTPDSLFPSRPHPHPSSVHLTSVRRAACSAAFWKAVDFEVFWQMIAAGKLLLADNALVGFYARVGTAVSGELIGSGEPARIRKQDVICWIITTFKKKHKN